MAHASSSECAGTAIGNVTTSLEGVPCPVSEIPESVIAEYTGGHFEETILDNEQWRGPVQYFDNRKEEGAWMHEN